MYRYQDRLRICEAFGDGQSTFPRVVLETDHVQDSTGHAYMIHNLDQPGMYVACLERVLHEHVVRTQRDAKCPHVLRDSRR